MPGMGNYIETLIALNALGRPASPIAVDQNGAPVLPNLPAPMPITLRAPTESPGRTPPLGLMDTFAPQQPPAAPQQPLDLQTVRRYLELAGPAPTAPVIGQPGFVEKLATVLQGVGAGLSGRGPEFVESVRERRQRPQREFERRQEQFEQRRQELGLIGTQEAMRQAERARERKQAAADRRFEMEVNERADQLGFVREREREEFRDLLLRRRETDKREAEEQMLNKRLEAQKKIEKSRRTIELLKTFRIEPAQASRIVDVEFGDAELRPSDNKIFKTIRETTPGAARRASSGTGESAAVRTLQQFEDAKQLLNDAVARADTQLERTARARLNQIMRVMAKAPRTFEFGSGDGGFPFAKLRTPQGSVALSGLAGGQRQAGRQQGGESITTDELRAYAAQEGIDEAEARRRAAAQGLTVR